MSTLNTVTISIEEYRRLLYQEAENEILSGKTDFFRIYFYNRNEWLFVSKDEFVVQAAKEIEKMQRTIYELRKSNELFYRENNSLLNENEKMKNKLENISIGDVIKKWRGKDIETVHRADPARW